MMLAIVLYYIAEHTYNTICAYHYNIIYSTGVVVFLLVLAALALTLISYGRLAVY